MIISTESQSFTPPFEASPVSASPPSAIKRVQAAVTGHLSSQQASPIKERSYLRENFSADIEKITDAITHRQITDSQANLLVHEIISKVLAYDLIKPNEEISIPVFQQPNVLSASFKAVLINLADGNVAYLFLPSISNQSEVNPILAFRGTSPTSASGSLRADMGFSAILPGLFSRELIPSLQVGRSVVNNSQEIINKLLKDLDDQGYKKVILTGHSLGGALASKFSIRDDNHKYVEKLVVFNAPGITKAEVEKYKNLDDKFKADTFQTDGDLIDFVASRRFFGLKHIIKPHDIPLKKGDLHSRCILSSQINSRKVLEPPKSRKALKALRVIGWITGINIVITVVYRIFALLLPAIVVEIYHATGKGDKVKSAHEAAIRARGQLGIKHSPLEKHAYAHEKYFEAMQLLQRV